MTDECNLGSNESAIEIFLRIRPSKGKACYFQVDDIETNRINFRLPLHVEQDVINNSRTHYGFQFNGILDQTANQDDVFRCVGLPAAQSVLEGFNSTIFAYGQTGSGKTFTITGGPERYSDRGIIPRSISFLFNEFKQRQERDRSTFTCYVSYLEIYNENGFDLLKKDADYAFTNNIPKVIMLEDEDGQLHFRNLTVHKVDSEEDALNLLFLGDTNRAIGETAMNQASSRSHCIFTLTVECRKGKSDTLVRSKLNLVDLAGSERVHKTNSAGQTLKEAQFINQSLFFLEMVIVALHEKSTKGDGVHIPYRNSMMTSVLRDSLGGNCKTVMIATMSPERDQTDESISTCHFAQRVALVKNQAYKNEEIQPEFVIQRLKQELNRLREEIRFLKGEDDRDDTMTPENLQKLEQCVHHYIEEDDASQLDIGNFSLVTIHSAFAIFKRLLKEEKITTLKLSHVEVESGGSLPASNTSAESTSADVQSEISALRKILRQRDKEISILVDMVKKSRASDSSKGYPDIIYNSSQDSVDCFEYCDPAILNDAAAAFSWFRSKYPGESKIRDDKDVLKNYVTEAKSLGERVKKSKDNIKNHMSTIESIRRELAINQLYQDGDSSECHPQEDFHREAIEKEKTIYSASINRIKELKTMIESMQESLERNQVQMQKSFDRWYETMCHGHIMLGTPIETKDTIFSGETKDTIFSEREIVVDAKPKINDVEIPAGVILTGDKQTDDDIIAFYRAKETLLGRSNYP